MRFDSLLASTVVLLATSATALPEPLDKRKSTEAWDRFSPPWYKAPPGGTVPQWKDAYEKAWKLVSQMTLVEKVNITSGLGWAMGLCVGNTGPVPRLNFPSLCLQDGPLGIRFADKITSFPAGITTGSTFNKALFRLRGEALGAETRDKGINVLLGPAMGPVGRHPAGGRNWEGFGNDAYLQGIASAETIKGIQSQSVIATAKHLVGNEQEHFRQSFDAISANIDDRTLHELYGWPFQDAVHAGVGSVMCSYQRLNNSHSCHNSKLMNGYLKDELGFQGFIHSDWLAAMSGVGSALAGLDMMMPGDGLYWDDRNPLWGPRLTTAVLNSSVPYDRLDDMATRIVATWYKYNNGDSRTPNFSSWEKTTLGKLYFGSNEGPKVTVNQHLDVRAGHAAVAKRVAVEGTVLLKNDGELLPLKKQKKIGVYGEDAGPGAGPNACADRGCNQGTLAVGWGSGTTDFEYLIDPLSQITADAKARGAVVVSELDNNKTAEAAASAAKQDVCLVFGNADSGEGFITWDENAGDRKDLKLQRKSEAMIVAVANACKNTVVVIHSVGQVDMEAFVTHKNVKAILWANLPGQESGRALSDIIFGVENPSGKLPYTIARKFSDYGPTAPIITDKGGADYPQADFTETIFTDYKRFDTYSIKPRFEFGFGLSYTTFSLSDVTVRRIGGPHAPLPPPRPVGLPPIAYDSKIPPVEETLYPKGFKKINRMLYPWIESASNVTVGPYPYPEGYKTQHPPSPAGGGEGGHPALWDELFEVHVTVKNTGKVYGAEVVQLYLEYPGVKEVKMPKRQLRGFEKVFLKPGEKKKVRMALTRRDVSYWSTVDQNWRIPKGRMEVRVGTSCRRLEKAVSVPN